MKKILVTGANGFIGRHTLPILVQKGWEVHAVCFSAPAPAESGVIWHQVDLLNREAAIDLVASVRASHLLHLAWYVNPVDYWSSPKNFKWVRGTLDMLDAFREAGGEHIIAAGTCAEYDWNYGYCREYVTPLAPTTVYGRCKHSLRQLLEVYGEIHGMRIAWGRLFYLYGPHEAPGRLVPYVANALLKGADALCTHGNQVRDFLHVEDVASAFVALVDSMVAGPVNISSGYPVALKEIILSVADCLGVRDRVRFGALSSPMNESLLLVGECRRLNDVGWIQRFDLSTGIEQTVNWWKSKMNGM